MCFAYHPPIIVRRLESCRLARPCFSQRWVEYTASASLMILALAISSGIREENTLIAVVSLMAITQCSALVVELGTTRAPSKETKAGPEQQRLSNSVAPGSRGSLQMLYSSETPSHSEVGDYFKRTAPALLGVAPYVVCWTIIINSFSNASSAASAEGFSVPTFVYVALSGTVVIFTLFAVPFFVYQAIDVGHYWESELWYRRATLPVNCPHACSLGKLTRGPMSQSAFADVQDVPRSPAFRGEWPPVPLARRRCPTRQNVPCPQNVLLRANFDEAMS